MKLWREKHTWLAKHAIEKLARLNKKDIQRIAVIKHAAYGDLLCTRPFLVTLRQHFPHAAITFGGINYYTRGIPEDLVDRVHLVPSRKEKKGHLNTLREYRKLGQHDLLFDLTGSTPSFLISYLNQASFKIGYQHRYFHKLIYDVAIPRAEFRFEPLTFLEQLNLLGIQAELPLDYGFKVEPMKRDKPYIIYFPTASTIDKCWPEERFTSLINLMAQEYSQHEHILLKGLADWEKQLVDRIQGNLQRFDNVLTLDAGPEDDRLIKGADILVANDTGIRHLGLALNTTTVCIFYQITPFGYWPRYGRHEVVFDPDGEPPAVEPVADAVRRILQPK